jgi:hypothetical protein
MFSDGKIRDRESTLRHLGRELGYYRLGYRVRAVLQNDLLIAVRRGILENTQEGLVLNARSITDCSRDSLKDCFLAAQGRSWVERDDAIRQFARWLGYARTGAQIEETAQSLINGLIREGRLRAEGTQIRKISS